jgi:DNA polymerase elongation subunit (family B)
MDTDCAEETTCRGRQYLRLMVKFFYGKYNFRPLVGDTDGFNFAAQVILMILNMSQR